MYGGRGEGCAHVTAEVDEGDQVWIGTTPVTVLSTPAHTDGHVVYVVGVKSQLACAEAVFSGDLIFIGGVGALFEGDVSALHSSLSKLNVLPDECAVFVGHEYTEMLMWMAAWVDPGNRIICESAQRASMLRAMSMPTTPSSMGLERKCNPYVRAVQGDELLKAAVGKHKTSLNVHINSRAGRFWKGSFSSTAVEVYRYCVKDNPLLTDRPTEIEMAPSVIPRKGGSAAAAEEGIIVSVAEESEQIQLLKDVFFIMGSYNSGKRGLHLLLAPVPLDRAKAHPLALSKVIYSKKAMHFVTPNPMKALDTNDTPLNVLDAIAHSASEVGAEILAEQEMPPLEAPALSGAQPGFTLNIDPGLEPDHGNVSAVPAVL